MKIIVLVKEVPDTYGARKLSLESGLADRAASDPVLDEIGERALEVALAYADGHPDTDVVLMTMGPETAGNSLRKGLALGAASAVHVMDERLAAADLGLTAEVLASAIERTGFDLVIAGNVSTDGSGGVIPAMIAEHLDVPNVTSLTFVEITTNAVSGTRATEYGVEAITAALPAVISVTEALPEARFANFKGIMAAKKKPVEILAAVDLGVDPEAQGNARSIVVAIAERPPRNSGIKIVDEGDAGQQLADFLVQNRLA